MKVLICDDMADVTVDLDRLLHESGFEIKTIIFHKGKDALKYINSGVKIDVCFLDIVMSEMSGIELAKQLRKDGYNGKIVFLSSSSEFGPETYEVQAFSYLLKPPTLQKVKGVLEKLAISNKNIDTAHILLETGSSVKNILLRDISHAEVNGHYVHYRLHNGSEIEIYATFKEAAQELLNSSRFVQCHRSFVVNMEEIAEMTNKEIILQNGKKIPISRNYSDVKKIYFNWKITGGG